MKFVERVSKHPDRRKLIKVDVDGNRVDEPMIVDIMRDDDFEGVTQHGTPITADRLNQGNWRGDKSLSFKKLAKDDEEPIPTANATQIFTRPDGRTWLLAPGNLRAPVEIGKTVGTTVQIDGREQDEIEFSRDPQNQFDEHVKQLDKHAKRLDKYEKSLSEYRDSFGQNILNLVYPIGSIYMSVVNTSPASFLGGTWAVWGQGRVPIGCGAPSANSSATHGSGVPANLGMAANVTSGLSNVALTLANLASHTHTGPAHTHTGPAHTHNMEHSHAIRSGVSSDSTPRGLSNSNTRSVAGVSGNNDRWSDTFGGQNATRTISNAVQPTGQGTAARHNTLSSGTGATGSSGTDDTGNAGSNVAHNNMMPYVTCFMWRRLS